jgi:hypothetical protein
MVTSANERTCLITSEHLHLQRLDRTSLGECIRYLRKLDTIWCTRRSEAQSRSSLTSTIASPRQPDTCCCMVRAGGTTYNIPNIIIEHHIPSPHPHPPGHNPLASNERRTSHFLCETNKRDRRNDTVCEKACHHDAWLEHMADMANSKQQEPN